MAKEFLSKYIIAHRGLYDNNKVMENTIPAFKHAIDNGYAIELDVRLTKDKIPIIFHDKDLRRLVGTDYIIEMSTYSELKNGIVKIPTLKQALECIDGKVPIIIELKVEGDYKVLVDTVVKELFTYNKEYYIKSFNYKAIAYLKRICPSIPRGLLITSKNNKLSMSSYIRILFIKPSFISCNKKILRDNKIQHLRKKIPVIAWTIDNKEDNKKAQKYCDNTVCEIYKMRKVKL